MRFDPEKHHRRSIRLAGYDYRAAGAYFVTLCADRRRPVFGEIENGAMRLNQYGRIVAAEWERTETMRANVVLDEFVVMPNHFHAIVVFTHDGDIVGAQRAAPETSCDQNSPIEKHERPSLWAQHAAPLRGATPNDVAAQSLSAVMRAFKSAVTRQINLQRAERGWSPVEVWQRGFHERIIRDETELNATRRYILENPQNWATDENHP